MIQFSFLFLFLIFAKKLSFKFMINAILIKDSTGKENQARERQEFEKTIIIIIFNDGEFEETDKMMRGERERERERERESWTLSMSVQGFL